MLYDVGESLREFLRLRCGIGTEIDIVHDAPTKEWAAKRGGPTVDIFLYDIRENLERRQNLLDHVRDGDIVTGAIAPTRWFNCSYLVTAWTQRPEDEHRLLGAIIQGFLAVHALPKDCLRGGAARMERQLFLTIARPLGSERSISDIWSALGGELKPSLDLVVHVPFEPTELLPVGPPVLEAPSLYVGDGETPRPRPKHDPGRTPGHRRAKTSSGAPKVPTAAERVPVATEEAIGGSAELPGRRFRFAVQERESQNPTQGSKRTK